MFKRLLDGEGWQITGWYRNQWKFTRSMELDKMLIPPVGPLAGRFPAAVQTNLIEAGLIENPIIGLNSLKAEWVNNREWFCDREISIPEDSDPAGRLFVTFLGLDTQGEIYLDDQKIGDFDSPLIPVDLELTGRLEPGENRLLRIVFLQTPEVDGQYGYTGRIRRFVSRFGYIWDWCPRMPQTGIWDSVFLTSCGNLRITGCRPLTVQHSGGWSIRGEIEVDAAVECPRAVIQYRLICYSSAITASAVQLVSVAAGNTKIPIEFEAGPVDAWFPAGMGQQTLYTLEIDIAAGTDAPSHSWQGRIGFRTLEICDNDGAPPGALPYTLRINERTVFMKGVNWVPASAYFAEVNTLQYRRQLTAFRDMGCNLIRVWGGAVLEKEAFYDICDELGLLIWQEFPQSSSGVDNLPSEAEEYILPLTAVAGSYLRRRARHASLVIWCGGNELMYPDYRPVGTEHAAIAALQGTVQRLDPGRIFLPASSSGPRFCAAENEFGKGVHHDVHGPWLFGGEENHFRFFNGDDSLLRSETGCPGTSRAALIRSLRGEYQAWPPNRDNPYWTHRGSWWLQWEELTRLFGEWNDDDLEAYCAASRFLQAVALSYAAEATLGREPESSGFIVWMGNEPFPNNANTSLLEYDGRPKPAWYAVRRSFDTPSLRAVFERMVWSQDEPFSARIFGKEGITASLLDSAGRILAEQRYPGTVRGEQFEGIVPGGAFFLRLRGEAEDFSRDYIFATAGRADDGEWELPFAALREGAPLLDTHSALQDGLAGYSVRNAGKTAAIGVSLGLPEEYRGPVIFNRGSELLLPGETLFFALPGTELKDLPSRPVIEALNFQPGS